MGWQCYGMGGYGRFVGSDNTVTEGERPLTFPEYYRVWDTETLGTEDVNDRSRGYTGHDPNVVCEKVG